MCFAFKAPHSQKVFPDYFIGLFIYLQEAQLRIGVDLCFHIKAPCTRGFIHCFEMLDETSEPRGLDTFPIAHIALTLPVLAWVCFLAIVTFTTRCNRSTEVRELC